VVVTVSPPKTPTQLRLTGPDGKTLEARAPLTLCGATPGTWRIRADAAGFAPAGTTVVVAEGAATRVEFPLQPRGTLEVTGSGKVTLVQANGRSSERTLPLTLTDAAPGVYTVKSLGGKRRDRRELWVMVPPTQRARTDFGQLGLVLNGRRFGLPPDSRITTFRERRDRSLYRLRRGRKTFRKRWFDVAPVKSLAELQWKVRSVIVHVHHTPTEEALASWIRARKGRHFVVEPDGAVVQLLDLVDQAHAVGHLLDETAVHVSLQVAKGAKASSAQQTATAALLGTLSALLPRVRPTFPRAPDGTFIPRRLVDPRAYKGWMQAHHVAATKTPEAIDEARLETLASSSSALTPVVVQETDDLRRYRSLTVTADPSEKATLTLTPPDGAPSDALKTGSTAVVCQPRRGIWTIEAKAADHTTRQLSVTIGEAPHVTQRTHLARVGALTLKGRSGQRATLLGPGGTSKVTLPFVSDRLEVGTYRLSIDRKGTGHEPYRIGLEVEPGQTTLVEVPDVTNASLPTILVGGQPYPLAPDMKVVHYEAKDAMSFYAAQKALGDRDRVLMKRPLPSGKHAETLAQAVSVTRMVVLHADVMPDTEATFGLLVKRGLSTHFAIEWDGTIYQMLDPREAAFAAAEVNPYSIQIDLNNLLPNLVDQPRAGAYPRRHRRRKEMRQPEFARPRSPRVMINNRDVQSYGYTEAQYRSLVQILRVLTGVFDGIAPRVPLNRGGQVPLDFFDEAETFGGIVAHWHLTPRRWDPGPGFDWKRLRDGLAGRRIAGDE